MVRPECSCILCRRLTDGVSLASGMATVKVLLRKSLKSWSCSDHCLPWKQSKIDLFSKSHALVAFRPWSVACTLVCVCVSIGEDIVFLATDINLVGAVDWVMMQTCFGHHFMLVLEKQERGGEASQMFYTVVQLVGSRKQAENFAYRFSMYTLDIHVITLVL